MRLRVVRSTSAPSRSLRYALPLALGAALLAGPALVSPVHAAVTSKATAKAPVKAHCKPMTRTAPGHVDNDAVNLNAAERAQSAAQFSRVITPSIARTAASVANLPAHILVPVYVHVIKGTHKGEQTVNYKKVARVMAILRGGFSGAQSSDAVRTRFSFTIKNVTYTVNDKWYHAALYNSVDQQAKRKLHRGFSRALNLYFSGAQAQGLPLLGYSRFPWQYHQTPKLDGVTINVNGLPGGKTAGYNLGDTVIHEVGHWLGLFHTFQSSTADGCDPVNDGVTDTPAEVDANFRCVNESNLCDPTQVKPVGPYFDPAYNFMDYTYDTCMRLFTKGQSDRMDYEYATYRY